MLVTLHFEPSCPWTWLTSRWLLRAAEVEDIEVGWAPFSLAHLDERSGAEGEHVDVHRAGRHALRVVQHLLDAGDHDAVGRYYDAYGTTVHRRGTTAVPELAAAVAREVGLGEAAVAAADDPGHDAALAVATDEAYAAAGPDIGSPVLQWVDQHAGDVWIFGPLFDRVVDADCAGEVWRGVRDLAVHGWFKELKRGRSGPPDTASS